MEVQTFKKEFIRPISRAGPRKTLGQRAKDMSEIFASSHDAEHAAKQHIQLEKSIFREAKVLLEEARSIRHAKNFTINTGGKVICSVEEQSAELLDPRTNKLYEKLKEAATYESMDKYAAAAFKIEAFDLDRASTIYAKLGHMAVQCGGHEYAASFYTSAAYKKTQSARILKERPAEFGPGAKDRVAEKFDRAFILFEKAIEQRAKHYDAIRTGQLDVKQAIADDAVGLFKAAYGIAYGQAKASGGFACDVELCRNAIRHKVAKMYDEVFKMTTCFTGLRDQILTIWTFPWQVYRN